MPNCRNCEQSIVAEIQFCPYCGQKNTDGKIRVRNFLTVFVNQVFNIESKLFKTLRDLFIPGKLTIEYFKGKHKTYFHPLRLFIVLTVILLASIRIFLIGENANIRNLDKLDFNNMINNAVLFYQLDSLNDINYQTQQYDSQTYTHISELVCNTLGAYEESTGSNPYVLKVDLFHILKTDGIKYADLLKLNDQEIIDKYNIEGFWNVLMYKQSLKFLKGAYGFKNFILSNALWVVLLMMPFLALILMLFYNKQKHYYVEHLVFSFHIHSFSFLLFIFIVFTQYLFNLKEISILLLLNLVSLAASGYVLFAQKKVYGQTWGTILLKSAGISFIYSILSLVFLILFLALGLLFF